MPTSVFFRELLKASRHKCTNAEHRSICINTRVLHRIYLYFHKWSFCIKKKRNSIVKMWWTSTVYFLTTNFRDQNGVFFFFFWNNNMEVPYFTQYHRLRTSMNVHQCVTYANISGISVQFLFICDHENEVYRNFVCAFYLQIIMINGVSPCHTTLGSFYACNLFVFDHVCVHAF